MDTTGERILLVEGDPSIQELIARQALRPLGYQVHIVGDVDAALAEISEFAPTLVIADLNLPGLSGKDLLAAFSSQGLPTPVIVIAEKGQENKVVQAFRLGAADYLLWPAREAEVVTAVERVFKQVEETRTRKRLDLQLKEINQELRRVRELTATFAVGKTVLAITDEGILFDKIVEKAIEITDSDYGWLLLRDESTQTFVLVAHNNLPDDWACNLGLPLDDGISVDAALSDEIISLNGEALNNLKVAALGQAAMSAPIRDSQGIIGILTVVRKRDQAFEGTMHSILGAVANYASISLVNAHLFHALRESAEAARVAEKQKSDELQGLQQEMHSLLQAATLSIDLVLQGKLGNLTAEQQGALKTVQASLERAARRMAANPSSLPAADQSAVPD